MKDLTTEDSWIKKYHVVTELVPQHLNLKTHDSRAGSRIFYQRVDFLLGISKSNKNRRYF